MKTMKNILFSGLLFGVVLSSCTVNKQTFIPTSGAFTYGIDLTEYADKEFLITPFEYRGDYLTVGIFTTEIIPEINLLNQEPVAYEGRLHLLGKVRSGYKGVLVRKSDFTYYALEISEPDLDEVIKEAHQFVLDVGGDAIMEFIVKLEVREGFIEGSPYEYTVQSVKGVAIKRY